MSLRRWTNPLVKLNFDIGAFGVHLRFNGGIEYGGVVGVGVDEVETDAFVGGVGVEKSYSYSTGSGLELGGQSKNIFPLIKLLSGTGMPVGTGLFVSCCSTMSKYELVWYQSDCKNGKHKNIENGFSRSDSYKNYGS